MNILSTTLLMMGGPGGGASGQGSGWVNLVFLLGIFIVMYLFMIRPQQKKASDGKKFLEELQKGDKIVNVAGIHGRILRINDNGTLEVEIDNNVKVIMERSGISMEYTKALNQDKK